MWVFREASDSNPYPAAYFTPEPLATSPTTRRPASPSSAPGERRVLLGPQRREAAGWRGGAGVISKCREAGSEVGVQ